jgi:hypothetical protein
VKLPAGLGAGRGFGDGVARSWSVCRGGFLADRGAGGGFVDDGLAGGAGGQQRGDGEPVDRPGQSSCLAVDDADRILRYLCLERIFAVFSQVKAVAYASVMVARGRAGLVALMG